MLYEVITPSGTFRAVIEADSASPRIVDDVELTEEGTTTLGDVTSVTLPTEGEFVITSYSIHYTKLYDFFFSLEGIELVHFEENLVQVSAFRIDFHLSGFYLGYIHQIFNQMKHALTAFFDDFGITFLLGLAQIGFLHKGSKTQNTIHRCANFVTQRNNFV